MSEVKDAVAMERRARRGRAWWEQAIARMEASGMSLAEFSQQEAIGYATLRRWRARLKRKGGATTRSKRGPQKATFLTLPIAAGGRTDEHDESGIPIEIAIDAGMRVRLSGPAAARMLEALLRRIERPAR